MANRTHSSQEEFYTKETTNGRKGITLAHMEELKSAPTNLTLTPEMFEKLYLAPQNRVSGDLRSTFGNPTPIAILGVATALTPLSVELMGWRGAAGFSATIGVNYFFGGMLVIITGLLEFLLGNTFPSVVFFGFGAHFLTFAATFDPTYAAISAYTTDGSQTQTPHFMAAFGFYTVSMAIVCTIFLICSIRTNVVFVLIFTAATLAFCFATGAFWSLAEGHSSIGATLLVGAGGSFFCACMFLWYLLLAMLLESVDMPFSLPVGDLSTVIKGATQKAKEKKQREE